MARNFTLFMNHSQLPDRGKLQAAIKTAGFKLTLEEDFDPAGGGYLPCTLDGEDAGFTLRFDNSDQHPGKDTAISLRWSSDPREQAAATMVAAVLAKNFDAVVSDHESVMIGADDLVTAANRAFSDLV